MTTFVDILRSHASAEPDRSALIFLGDGQDTLSYCEVDARARAIASRLQRMAVPGARALLLYPPGAEFVAAFAGCLYAGVIAVPAYPPDPLAPERSLRVLEGLVAGARPTVVLTSSAGVTVLERACASGLPGAAALAARDWLASDTCLAREGLRWATPALTGDDLAFLQYTSGSTSRPKGVMVSHANLIANEEMVQAAVAERLGPIRPQDATMAGWLPLYHDMGLIGMVLRSLYLGTTCALMAPHHFLQRPVQWLRLISEHRVTMTGGPNFGYELCLRRVRPEDCEGLDLSSWSVAFNGAEPVRSGTLEAFARRFAPYGFRADSFFPCYGLAEATLICSGGPGRNVATTVSAERAALEADRLVEAQGPGTTTLVGCGEPVQGLEVAIVDPVTHERSAPDAIGEIWVAGASVARGYWDDALVTERDFGAHTTDGAGPFLRTGDLGALRDGELYIAGRLKDLIVIDGRNLHPADLEQTVDRAHPAVRPGCAAAFGVTADGAEQVVIAVETRPDATACPDEVQAAIRAAVASEHGVGVHAVSLLAPGGLPKTTSGKVQRSRARRAFELAAVAA